MPNIEDFSAGNIAIRPTETGVEAAAAAGRRLGAYGSQIASAYQQAAGTTGRAIKEAGDTAVSFIDHQQINAGADHSSAMWANLEDNWNRTASSADPHDPSTAAKWRNEVLEPTLQQFNNGFTTEKSQEWANRTVNTMRQHFFTQTEGEMSAIAKVAVTATAKSMRDNLSVAAMQNPGGVSAMLDQVDDNLSTIVDRHPNLKGAEAASVRIALGDDIKRQIVHAGAVGAMSSSADPEASLASYLKNNDVIPYVNATEEAQFAKTAKIQAKQNTLLTKQLQNEAKQTDTFNMETFLNASSTKNVAIQPDGTSRIDPQFVKDVNDITQKFPNAPNAWKQKEELGNWIAHQQANPKGGVDDSATLAELDSRLFSADNPTTLMDLRRAQLPDAQHPNGKISNRNFSIREGLIKERDSEPIKNPIFKAATDQAKIAIEGTTPGEKAFAGGKYAAFMQNFLTEYLKESRAGTLPPNALDLTDETSLISKTMAPFRMNLGASISANGGVGAPAQAPAAPLAPDRTLPRYTTKRAYDDAPPGPFIGPDGKQYIKPASGGPAVTTPQAAM